MSTNQEKRKRGTIKMIENRNVNIITDADGKKLVLINDIRFKGKRQIDWDNAGDADQEDDNPCHLCAFLQNLRDIRNLNGFIHKQGQYKAINHCHNRPFRRRKNSADNTANYNNDQQKAGQSLNKDIPLFFGCKVCSRNAQDA